MNFSSFHLILSDCDDEYLNPFQVRGTRMDLDSQLCCPVFRHRGVAIKVGFTSCTPKPM